MKPRTVVGAMLMRCLAATLITGCVMLGPEARGQALQTWVGSGGGDWDVDANWDFAQPVDDDSVLFGPEGSGSVNTMNLPGLNLNKFTVSNAYHATDLDGNALTLETLVLDGAGAGSTGDLSVANGTLRVGAMLKNAAGNVSHARITMADDAVLHLGQDVDNRAQVLLGTESSQVITYLTVGELLADAYLFNLKVGSRPAAGDGGYAEMDLRAVTNSALLDVAGTLEVAVGRSSAGRLLLADTIDLKVGSALSRAILIHVGDSLRPGSNYLPPGQSAVSEMVLGKGRFDVHVATLKVGTGQNGNGLIDATNSLGGIVDVSGTLHLGDFNTHAGPIGSLLLSDAIAVRVGSESARGNITSANGMGTLTMGTNTFEAYLDTLSVSRINLNLGAVASGVLDVAGSLAHAYRGATSITLSDGFRTKFGKPDGRLNFDFMEGRIGINNTQCKFSAGGSFHAWLNNVRIGVDASTGQYTRNQYATLDFSSATNFIFDVGGDMIIAGPGQDQRVTVIMPDGNVMVSGDLSIGGTGVGSTPSASFSYGVVIMTGTHFRVDGAVTLDGAAAYPASRARILTVLTGKSGGLDLGPDASLTVNHGLIDIAFAEEPVDKAAIYWGLRWQGDHVAELQDLEVAGKLTWDDEQAGPVKAGIFKAGGYTYVGIPSPRGPVFMTR